MAGTEELEATAAPEAGAEAEAFTAGWLAGADDGVTIEQQLGGAAGLGADTPAISEPSPSFWSVGASSFPVVSIPLADWNFRSAAIVLVSILPLGSPS